MEDLKEEIINRSFALFLSKGYAACSLKDLEQALGITKGAFYYYFRNKDDILKSGIEKYLRIGDEMSEAEFLAIDSLKTYIRVLVDRMEGLAVERQKSFGFFVIEAAFFQLVMEVGDKFPDYRIQVGEILRNRLTRWEFIILKSKQQGEIQADIDTSILARNFMSVASSMLNIELETQYLQIDFSDMRRQFDQYYMLIKQ